MLKGREKQTQKWNNEVTESARGIVDTGTPRMRANTLVKEIVFFMYPCHSNVQLFPATSVVEIAEVTIDIIRNNHRCYSMLRI